MRTVDCIYLDTYHFSCSSIILFVLFAQVKILLGYPGLLLSNKHLTLNLPTNPGDRIFKTHLKSASFSSPSLALWYKPYHMSCRLLGLLTGFFFSPCCRLCSKLHSGPLLKRRDQFIYLSFKGATYYHHLLPLCLQLLLCMLLYSNHILLLFLGQNMHAPLP